MAPLLTQECARSATGRHGNGMRSADVDTGSSTVAPGDAQEVVFL